MYMGMEDSMQIRELQVVSFGKIGLQGLNYVSTWLSIILYPTYTRQSLDIWRRPRKEEDML